MVGLKRVVVAVTSLDRKQHLIIAGVAFGLLLLIALVFGRGDDNSIALQEQEINTAATSTLVPAPQLIDPTPGAPTTLNDYGLQLGNSTESFESSVQPDPTGPTNSSGRQLSLIGGGSECTIFVSSNGNDGASGNSEDQALRNPAAAVSKASAGDVVCFLEGRYGHLNIAGKNGRPKNPIEFRSVGGEASFALGGYTAGPSTSAVAISNSSHIVVDGLASTNSMRGVTVKASRDTEIINCRVWDTGQEGIHISDKSSNVRIAGCDVSRTGNRSGVDGSQNLAFSVFGELVYVGTGSSGGDTTNNVIVENNVLHDNGNATAEAVNVKSSTSNVTVRNNHIYNIDSWCEGAIRANNSNNLAVVGNVIHDITASGTGGDGNRCSQSNGIRYSASNATVENNLIFRAGNVGIWAENGSSGVVRNNTLFDNGTDFRSDGSAQASDNVTSDGTTGQRVTAQDFTGPITGQADAGSGAGSGFNPLSPIGGFSPS